VVVKANLSPLLVFFALSLCRLSPAETWCVDGSIAESGDGTIQNNTISTNSGHWGGGLRGCAAAYGCFSIASKTVCGGDVRLEREVRFSDVVHTQVRRRLPAARRFFER